MISEHMANVMGVKKGSTIEVKVTYPEERISRVTVTDTIAQYMGKLCVYVRLKVRQRSAITAVYAGPYS